MKAYNGLIKNKQRLKNSEKKAKGIFCLPLYPELSSNDVNKICFILKNILKKI
jgi:dTDP-4-amino-4,6-dideoxygalactose transaminase